MKYVIVGTGKTGPAVLDAFPASDIAAVCNSRDPVTRDRLNKGDIGVVFVPPAALANIMPILLSASLPLVIGTTGYPWPQDLDETLRAKNLTWVIGQNFSLGLNVMRYFAKGIQETLDALRPGHLKLAMSETHHVKKVDAPSGTALFIAKTLRVSPSDIEVFREGDARGTHSVIYNWPQDRLTFTHEALDRGTFAEGVLLATQHIHTLQPGLHHFEDLADTLIEQL
jgi:4-hydroxy-tetrahydrodipicolinate reductase